MNEPTSPSFEAPAEPAAAPESAPAPEAAPSPTIEDVQREHASQTARLESALRKAERRGLDSKNRVGELEEAQKTLEAWRGDKWAAAKELGITFDEMSQRIVDGADNPSPADVEKQRERAELATIREQLEAERSIREERDTAAGFESDVQQISKMLPEDSLAKALGQERLITQYLYEEHRRTGEVPDVQDMIDVHEKQTVSNLKAALQSEAGRAAILADDDIKAVLLAALNPDGVGDSGEGTADKQRSESEPRAKFGQPNHRVITNALAGETTGRGIDKVDPSEVTDADRRTRAIEVMRQLRKAQAG